jgi:hypothetical protein
MTKKELFLKTTLIPMVVFIFTFILSFFSLYENVSYYSGRIISNHLWDMITVIILGLDRYYSPSTIFFLVLHFLFLLGSFSLLIIGLRSMKNYLGFPSIQEAKLYTKEKKRIEKTKRLYQAKVIYQKKMQELQDDKKNYL